MTEYTLTLKSEKTALSGDKTKLDVWVELCSGFEDPGVFLLHRRRNIVNEAAPPVFETFANPCTLVEYPYRMVERNYGMYRDRELSLLFDTDKDADIFLEEVEKRRKKLVDLMNGMESDIESSPIETIGDVSIRKSMAERNFMMIDFQASNSTPFLFKEDKSFNRFIGVAGDCKEKGVPKSSLRVITYTPRSDIFMTLMRTSLSRRVHIS